MLITWLQVASQEAGSWPSFCSRFKYKVKYKFIRASFPYCQDFIDPTV